MRIREMLSVSNLVLACGLLGACASDTNGPRTPRQSAGEAVVVHTDGDAATLLATNYYRATHVKIGARWFPRCQTFTNLGSITDVQTACMSDAQIREIAESSNAQQQEFLQRSGAIAGLQSN